MQHEIGFDQDAGAARDHPPEWPSRFFRPTQFLRYSLQSLLNLVFRSGFIRVDRRRKRSQRHPRIEDRGPRIEDRVNFRSSIFDPRPSILGPRSSVFGLRSSIFDLRPSTLVPHTHHRDSPFVTVTSLTTGRHLWALVRGTCSTNSILTSRPGRLAVTMFSICRRLSSPKPFFGAIMNWTE